MLASWLVRRLVKGGESVEDPAVRQRYGNISGEVGVVLNLLLSGGKLAAGLMTGSIAIVGDALNNLTDAGSSVVTLVGFRLAGKKADEGHPFGHGRAEYVSGFVVSLLILLVAVELGKSSLEQVIAPGAVAFSWVAAGVLGASILVKLWMWRFNRALGRHIGSVTLAASASDALSDCAATLVALMGMVAGELGAPRLDGVVGLAVAVFIARTGFLAAKNTLDPLLGKAPDRALAEEIRRVVLESPEIIGVHDLAVHEYGPGHVFATVHAEVSSDADIVSAHHAIDRVERALWERCRVHAVVHMDPISPEGVLLDELEDAASERADTEETGGESR